MALVDSLRREVTLLTNSTKHYEDELLVITSTQSYLEQEVNTHIAGLNDFLLAVLPSSLRLLQSERLDTDRILFFEAPVIRTIIDGLLPGSYRYSNQTTTNFLHSLCSGIQQISTIFQVSHQLVKEEKQKATNLAHEAATHKHRCMSIVQKLNAAECTNKSKLQQAQNDITSLQSKLDRNKAIANAARFRAANYQQRKWTASVLIRRTWFIPVVDLFTVPIGFFRKRHHRAKCEAYNSIGDIASRSMCDNEAQLDVLKAEGQRLSSSQQDLQNYMQTCGKHEAAALHAVNTAKTIIDRYAPIAANLKHVANALENVSLYTDEESWNRYRIATLQSFALMIQDLQDSQLLDQKVQVIYTTSQVKAYLKEYEKRDAWLLDF